MNRRAFLKRLGIGAGAIVAAPVLAQIIAAPRPRQSFSMRYVQHFDAATHLPIDRYDVLYGIGTLRPEFACRVMSA